MRWGLLCNMIDLYKFKSHKVLTVISPFFSHPILFKFCTEHCSHTAIRQYDCSALCKIWPGFVSWKWLLWMSKIMWYLISRKISCIETIPWNWEILHHLIDQYPWRWVPGSNIFVTRHSLLLHSLLTHCSPEKYSRGIVYGNTDLVKKGSDNFCFYWLVSYGYFQWFTSVGSGNGLLLNLQGMLQGTLLYAILICK